jgi:hypothetical protein
MTGIIFFVTLTVAACAFPVIIIVLVPVRLLVMNRMWNRETLRYVDAWTCKEETPEDEEDRRNGMITERNVKALEKTDESAQWVGEDSL